MKILTNLMNVKGWTFFRDITKRKFGIGNMPEMASRDKRRGSCPNTTGQDHLLSLRNLYDLSSTTLTCDGIITKLDIFAISLLFGNTYLDTFM